MALHEEESAAPARARARARRHGPPAGLARQLRGAWRHLCAGVRIYAHVMVGVPLAPPPPEAGPPLPGHPERIAADTPLSPDEQLWATELAA